MREEIKICTFYIFSHKYDYIISYGGRNKNGDRLAGSGFGVQGSGFGVQGSGFGLKGSTGSEGSTGVVRRVRKKAPRSLKIGDARGPYTKSPFPSGRGRPKGGG